MLNFQEKIWEPGEYCYEAAYGFEPDLYAYLHDDDSVRACMLVVPGGGYCMVCNVEGEPVVKEFFDRGMNAFVLTYTTDITMSVPLKMQPANDLSRAIRYIRANASRFHIDPDRLSIAGFSAGGHLCASVAVHYDDIEDTNPKYAEISNRPDSFLLGYPVISTEDCTHRPSIEALLGKNPEKKELEYFSVDLNVNEKTPPCFLWQTVEDDLVPIENSALMAESLRKRGIPYAYYAFPHGRHGLSACNDMVKSGEFGPPYTFRQLDLAIENVKNNTAINVSQQRQDELMLQFFGTPEDTKDEQEPEQSTSTSQEFWDDVALWPQLAYEWLKSIKMV